MTERPDLRWAAPAGRATAILRMIVDHQNYPGLLEINLAQAREYLAKFDEEEAHTRRGES